ncbi:CocE/NonD family hydrolase [Kibdelosporangium phytohabitans]|uniref:X-Pro dipeptidyl-peptidase n=1 Tax=Kibdelosporangium phytohabitans TaxID=860235 RepID=A0A0N9HVM2_9PSEU|nr:CocE/NonD family hydrolase [Kibdelosporangium phytohabitans]ALG06145.1 X-Pro dipeptidyl-peptidase [Kibdelosporangium phytohabitans]MBE1465763.1 putative acyl esterase [Kibdelosporangium phytohabitans]
MRSSRLLTLLTAVVAVGALSAPVSGAATSFGADISYQSIPGEGGTPMRGFVVKPTGRGDGPFPLLVMPASWSAPNLEYVGAARKLAAESGDIVISYTSRGFYDSGGEIDVAGPDTVDDVSRVIDWALANTPADVNKIGVAGISYGAGIGLLAAANDKRVKAVASMSTWADLEASLYPNATISQLSAGGLLAAGQLTGRPGPDLRRITAEFLQGKIDYARQLAPSRSASSKVDQINANGAAVFIANSFQDAIFPPNQAVDFYDRLRTPKRLMLQGGDHATSELLGAVGLSNDVWDTATDWFDRYLNGIDNGIDRTPPVQVMSANAGKWRGYQSWASAATTTDTVPLGAKTFVSGVDSAANSGIPILSGALQGYFKIPVGVFIPAVLNAGVWHGPVYSQATTVVGKPKLTTTVKSGNTGTTLVAYLYDVDPAGFGALITHKPYTIRGTKSATIDFALESISWDVPAGHHLALVVDSADLRYTSESKAGLVKIDGTLTVPRR